jgi:thioredoxin reductase
VLRGLRIRAKKKDAHISGLFSMTGAVLNSGWLNGCVALDADGFIKTGSDLTKEGLTSAHWPLSRAPYLFETSLPGVLAVGDVILLANLVDHSASLMVRMQVLRSQERPAVFCIKEPTT